MKVWEEGTPFDWPEKFTYMGAAVPERTPERQIRFNTYEAYAHGLFSALRDLEKDGLPIVAQWPPLEGLGRAIRDRISRAAGLS